MHSRSPQLNIITSDIMRDLDEDALKAYGKPYAECSYNQQGMLRDALAEHRS